MLIFLLAYLGGVLTILSPCVLPVLPFVFTRSDQPFRRAGLPVLIGMSITFAALASIASIGGSWLVEINQYGRDAAMLLLLVLGLALIFPALSERLMHPFVSLGGRLQQHADSGIKGSLLLGVAIGFLWAPCAGPILGLVLAGAALNGANLHSALLLLVFAAGAATSLAVALLAGSRALSLMKRSFAAEVWIKRGLGVAVVTGVVVIASGWGTRLLSKFDFFGTASTEQKLIAQFDRASTARSLMPPLTGATKWLNSAPLDAQSLRGKVVLVDFWTYSCINCLRTLPYIKAWNEKYRDQGLVVIGVHAPEFAFEKDERNVERAVRDLGITYPVALDNQYAIWNAYRNEYWPAHYLIDTTGKIRHQHFGESEYENTELTIQTLLKEANHANIAGGLVQVSASGVMAKSDATSRSPETYLGYERAQNFASIEPEKQDVDTRYRARATLEPDQWALEGDWTIQGESVTSKTSGGAISYRFRGRDLHLVMGADHPTRFRVTLDGKPPGGNHGTDTDAAGSGVIQGQRLYQLIRQNKKGESHLFRIEFLDQGAQAFAFTFG